MIIFNSDLDNTLIYSYKRDIGGDKKCVEIYYGREISFMTHKSYEMLKQVKEKVLFVPTTTRTIEQYNRIDLGIGTPEYALVCNGGVLLINGEEDEKWFEESKRMVADCQKELYKANQCLAQDENINFEIRNIKELFIFTKSSKPDDTIKRLREMLDTSLVDVLSNGVKVYVIPKKLNKGMAVKRLKERLKADSVIAAGDSEFDVSMLKEADVPLIHPQIKKEYFAEKNVISFNENVVFSDNILEYILKM